VVNGIADPLPDEADAALEATVRQQHSSYPQRLRLRPTTSQSLAIFSFTTLIGYK
jgi:hypothetical protein